MVRLHRCETIVLGAPKSDVEGAQARLEALIASLDVDVAMLRATWRWRVARVRRALVPLGGVGHHSRLRARLLASLNRVEDCDITFLRSVAPDATPTFRRSAVREVRARASDEAEGRFNVLIEEDSDPVEAIARHAAEYDLIVMGFQHGAAGAAAARAGARSRRNRSGAGEDRRRRRLQLTISHREHAAPPGRTR